jgi:gamma-glutamyl hydrolase
LTKVPVALLQLEGLLGRLNGFLIPGGAANLRPGHDFFDTAARVLDYALRSNDAGNVFPVMGICLGFETLMVLTAGKQTLM